jgi:prepilin-type N-terminal cleavage/methylation domain-containing protein
MRSRDHSGFTLVELLLVTVLGAFLALAAYQVLITNSRTHSVNAAQIQGQQTLRSGVDMLFGELREISAADGDLLAMNPESLTIRAQRTFGLVCTTNYAGSPPELKLYQVGPFFETGDSIVVFAENDPETTNDDTWLWKSVHAVDTTAVCDTSPAQILSITGLATSGDTVRVGAPVRAFQEFTYGIYEFEGEKYLGRRARGAAQADLLAGPVNPYRGVTFEYLDSMGNVTTVDTLVTQIEVSVRYQAEILGPDGSPVADSLVVRVFPRN